MLSRKRIAQWVRNCRNYATKHRNAPARTQGRGDFQIGRCRASGHDRGAEGIDGGLDHHIGQGEDDALEAGGQAHLKDPTDDPLVQVHPVKVQVQRPVLPHQAAQDQPGRDILGNAGGHGDTCHIQPANDDKEQVQHHIEHTCSQQEIERALGVSLGAQDGAAEVVHHGGRHADEVNPQIHRGQPDHIFRGGHPLQHLAGHNDAEDHQDHAADHSQQD